MTEQQPPQRLTNRIQDADWAEVLSYPGGESLALGHLKDVSEGGISLDLPKHLSPGTLIQVKLSRMTHGGLLRHFQFTGTVVHVEEPGEGCVHGIKFASMTPAERTALTEYLCHVEHQSAS